MSDFLHHASQDAGGTPPKDMLEAFLVVYALSHAKEFPTATISTACASAVPLTRRITVAGFGRYNWSQTLDGSVGPAAFSVDLRGWSLGALLGGTF